MITYANCNFLEAKTDAWSDRQKERYQPRHVRLPWQRLHAEGWAPQWEDNRQ